MIIYNSYKGLTLPPVAIATGMFDGVHRGHRSVIEHLVKSASERRLEPVVLTFDPHPKAVLRPLDFYTKYLTTVEEKGSLLGGLGVKHLIVAGFTEELRMMDTCRFVEEILINRLNARHLVVGFNNQFGRGRSGDFTAISACASVKGITADLANEIKEGGKEISSTLIRNYIDRGDVSEAAILLGYNYNLTGTVVRGRAIGRTIGFPTANIEPVNKNKLVPGNGVYAVKIEVDNNIWNGAMSIGVNPTVSDLSDERTLEVNIMGFSGDLYGKPVKIIFFEKIREEEKFSSMEELATQINKDREKAMAILAGR
jgi:riboflavin kinase/FMN adenylyltransferase